MQVGLLWGRPLGRETRFPQAVSGWPLVRAGLALLVTCRGGHVGGSGAPGEPCARERSARPRVCRPAVSQGSVARLPLAPVVRPHCVGLHGGLPTCAGEEGPAGARWAAPSSLTPGSCNCTPSPTSS